MATPNTPLLDTQILKLRRLLGDINNEDGVAIDSSNVYTSTSGVTWKQQELLDIYNDAIRQFMVYLVQRIPKEMWWEFLPGYVIYSPGVALTDDKVLLDSLDPTMFELLDLRRAASTNLVKVSGVTGGLGAGGSLTGELYYVVSAINPAGEALHSDEVHLSVEGVPQAASLVWDAQSDASMYRVYRGTTPDGEDVYFETSSNSFIDLGGTGKSGTPAIRPVGNLVTDLAAFIPPHQWFACIAGLDKVRKPDATHIFYTVLAINSGEGEINSALWVAPTGISTVDLIYLRDHEDWIQDSADRGDLWGFSQDGLRRVLTFAEVIARRWKSTEAADVPEAMLKQMVELDINKSKE